MHSNVLSMLTFLLKNFKILMPSISNAVRVHKVEYALSLVQSKGMPLEITLYTHLEGYNYGKYILKKLLKICEIFNSI